MYSGNSPRATRCWISYGADLRGRRRRGQGAAHDGLIPSIAAESTEGAAERSCLFPWRPVGKEGKGMVRVAQGCDSGESTHPEGTAAEHSAVLVLRGVNVIFDGRGRLLGE